MSREQSESQSPKIEMGSGVAPPRLVKHIKKQVQQKNSAPKVEMGSGIAPPRVVKHIRTQKN